jgi:uncharacterized membrane protein YGL010W
MGLWVFDLEKHVSFYGAYHKNKVNSLIHALCVWPILFSSLLLLAYTKQLVPQLPWMPSSLQLPSSFSFFFFFFFHRFMVLNYSFVIAVIYAVLYVSLDPRAGSLAAFLVLACWVGANAVAQNLPICCGRKLFLLSQLICWSCQFVGHAVFEKRAPALLYNLPQALLIAPLWVLLQLLHSAFHYEPYPGFTKNVEIKVIANIAQFHRQATHNTHNKKKTLAAD